MSILNHIRKPPPAPDLGEPEQPKDRATNAEATPQVTAPKSNNQNVVAALSGYRTTFVPPRAPTKKPARKEPLVPKDAKAFDVRSDVRRGRAGRRTAIPGAKRNRKLTANVSGLEYVAIVQAAEDQGVSTSCLLRMAVFDAYGVPRPHPEKVPTVAQSRRRGAQARKKKAE